MNREDVIYGEPIEEREGTYLDGYTQGIYKARNIIDNKQKEIERLNNIISEALGIANERINYYYHNKNDELLKEWKEIFEELIKRDTELKGDNK